MDFSDTNNLDNNFGGEKGRSGPEEALPLNTTQLGLWVSLATITMLFAGFTSAYLVRRIGSDWQPISMPSILWFNSALLILSSTTMEVARAFIRQRRLNALKGWLLVTILLGIAFLMGQLFAWRQLATEGIFLSSNPHSSFFYMLTGVHGVHLLGGILALFYVLIQTWRYNYTLARADAFNLCATYWHFMDGLWLYLFLMLFIW